MPLHPRVLVLGAGVFGVTAAIELRRRGCQVSLVDPGPLPHPAASSTDISKAVRMDYGSDLFYTDLADQAICGWRAWSDDWPEPLFHEVGILMLKRTAMGTRSFEGASFKMMQECGVPVERLDAASLARRFPAWAQSPHVDGYYNPWAGYAVSGAVMAWLVEVARAAGVHLCEGMVWTELLERASRVVGARCADGTAFEADVTIVASGAWTPERLGLEAVMRAVGQPVLHFTPPDPAKYVETRFPVWCADIAKTGWYGFPLDRTGVLKIGHHGPGRPWHHGEPLEVSNDEIARCRRFLAETLPDIADAPLRSSRLCLYCDTWDGNFWIDHHPDRPGLVVACGGSGHAFKFAPLLGTIIADVVEGQSNDAAARFAWRRPGSRTTEQARFS